MMPSPPVHSVRLRLFETYFDLELGAFLQRPLPQEPQPVPANDPQTPEDR